MTLNDFKHIFVTLAFTSTRVCRCRVMSNRSFSDASLFYASYVLSGGRYQLRCSIQSRIVALVLSRLDYCNSILFGLPANLIQLLQRCCTSLLQNPTIRAYYSHAHQPSLAAHPRAHLLQIGCPDVPIHQRHFT